MSASPHWFWSLVAFLYGTVIGSFLNVVIWRLPRGGSLTDPKWSYCPNCKNRLTGKDLVPLFSFLLLGRKCRNCSKPISWRYFCVELLTGALFVALYLRFSQDVPNCIALLLFTAVLIPIFFIDLERFIIPDQLNMAVFLIALGRDAYGIAANEPGHELLWGWLPRSILGAVVGALIFGGVRVVGWIWKGVEAMGMGDVYLARAMGAMLVSVTPPEANPLRLFVVWVLFSCFSGILVGIPLILARARQEAAALAAGQPVIGEGAEPVEENVREGTLGRQLLEASGPLWLADFIFYFGDRLKLLPPQPQEADEEDDWTPAPTAIPFGPFMVIGFLLTAFVGEALTVMYLNYALPKPTDLPPLP